MKTSTYELLANILFGFSLILIINLGYDVFYTVDSAWGYLGLIGPFLVGFIVALAFPVKVFRERKRTRRWRW